MEGEAQARDWDGGDTHTRDGDDEKRPGWKWRGKRRRKKGVWRGEWGKAAAPGERGCCRRPGPAARRPGRAWGAGSARVFGRPRGGGGREAAGACPGSPACAFPPRGAPAAGTGIAAGGPGLRRAGDVGRREAGERCASPAWLRGRCPPGARGSASLRPLRPALPGIPPPLERAHGPAHTPCPSGAGGSGPGAAPGPPSRCPPCGQPASLLPPGPAALAVEKVPVLVEAESDLLPPAPPSSPRNDWQVAAPVGKRRWSCRLPGGAGIPGHPRSVRGVGFGSVRHQLLVNTV